MLTIDNLTRMGLGKKAAKKLESTVAEAALLKLRELASPNIAKKLLPFFLEDDRLSWDLSVVGALPPQDFESELEVQDIYVALLRSAIGDYPKSHIVWLTLKAGRMPSNYLEFIKEMTGNHRKLALQADSSFEGLYDSIVQDIPAYLSGKKRPNADEYLKMLFHTLVKDIPKEVPFIPDMDMGQATPVFRELAGDGKSIYICPETIRYDVWVKVLYASMLLFEAKEAFTMGQRDEAYNKMVKACEARKLAIDESIAGTLRRDANRYWRNRDSSVVVIAKPWMVHQLVEGFIREGCPATAVMALDKDGESVVLDRPIDIIHQNGVNEADIISLFLTFELEGNFRPENLLTDEMGFPVGSEETALFVRSIPEEAIISWWQRFGGGYRHNVDKGQRKRAYQTLLELFEPEQIAGTYLADL